jgi:hypothetical protein
VRKKVRGLIHNYLVEAVGRGRELSG